MVKKDSETKGVKIGALDVNKETVADLEGDEMAQVRGGLIADNRTGQVVTAGCGAKTAKCRTDLCPDKNP